MTRVVSTHIPLIYNYLRQVVHFMHSTLNNLLICPSFWIHSSFYGLVNATSASIGVENRGCREPQSGRFPWFQQVDIIISKDQALQI